MTFGGWFTRGEPAGEASSPAPGPADPELVPQLPTLAGATSAAIPPAADAGEPAPLPPPAEPAAAVTGLAMGEQIAVPPQRAGTRAVAAPGFGDAEAGWPQVAAWLQARWVPACGLGIVAVQSWWKAAFLGHFYFLQDDYHYLDRALDNGFTWKYLMYIGSGHLIAGPYAISWLVARVSLYDWTLASGIALLLATAAGLAMLRLLLTLFGARPAILLPLTVYLFSPLTLPSLGWWSSAIESLPLQAAILMALDAHVRYLRSGRWRHVAAAAAWLGVGMLFFEKGMVAPLLLFAVTSAFFVEGRWFVSAYRALTRYRRAWLAYAAVLGVYASVFAVQLRSSIVQPSPPHSFGNLFAFGSHMVGDNFVPGALGGPWRWFSNGSLAYAAPPSAAVWLSLLVAGVVVGWTSLNRQYAWRAWAILAGWLVAADMIPIVLGRLGVISGSILALETRYVADAVPVMAVCLSLALWPAAGGRSARRPRRAPAFPPQATATVAAALVSVFVLGSLGSARAYEGATSSAPARVFIANAEAALASMPYGAAVVDQPVPGNVVTGFFGTYSYASQVVGKMTSSVPGTLVDWIRQPDGTIDKLMAFGVDGRLRLAADYGPASRSLPAGTACWPKAGGTITVRLQQAVSKGSWTLYLHYAAAAVGRAIVGFGGRPWPLALARGEHDAYLPVTGGSSEFTVTAVPASGLCVRRGAVGLLAASASGPAIPDVSAQP